jgi:hypothetical protein
MSQWVLLEKIQLLLRCSVRYSYRQRCCNCCCCPTILCELLFPIIMILLLILASYKLSESTKQPEQSDISGRQGSTPERPCSQNTTVPPASSKEIFAECFRFPPNYQDTSSDNPDSRDISTRTNLVFQPISIDTDVLVRDATARLAELGCSNTFVWYENHIIIQSDE